MAVRKVFDDDLSGDLVSKDELIVVRVGLHADRIEDYERIDLGPGSLGREIRELVILFNLRRAEREQHGAEQAPA